MGAAEGEGSPANTPEERSWLRSCALRSGADDVTRRAPGEALWEQFTEPVNETVGAEAATLWKQRSAPQRDRAQPRSAAQTGAQASPLLLVSGSVEESCCAGQVPVQQQRWFGDTARLPPAPPAVCSRAPLPAGGARGRHVWLPEWWCGCQHATCSPCWRSAPSGVARQFARGRQRSGHHAWQKLVLL